MLQLVVMLALAGAPRLSYVECSSGLGTPGMEGGRTELEFADLLRRALDLAQADLDALGQRQFGEHLAQHLFEPVGVVQWLLFYHHARCASVSPTSLWLRCSVR